MSSAGDESQGLIVRASGGVLVATDDLLAQLAELTRLADTAEADAHRGAVLGLDCPPGVLRRSIEEAERLLFEAADHARRLQAGVLAAQSGYAQAERLAELAAWRLSDTAAATFGRSALASAALLLPGALVGGLLGWAQAPGDDAAKKRALHHWLLEHPEVITNPEFVTLVRRVITAADDAVLGVAGVPPLLLWLLGDQGVGVLGVGASAASVIRLGGLVGAGVLQETPVRTERVATTSGTRPPTGAADRLSRVPGEQQVRIERYRAPGAPDRFVVYVAPTQTFSPRSDSEPWDLTSNIAGVGELPAGSVRATEQAMVDAGITEHSEVVLVGYSQGGLVADALAASGHWNAVGLESYGDPGVGIELPEGIRGVAVRHSDDLVVATGGHEVPGDRVVVERRAYPEGSAIPTDALVPAHQKRAYLETARLLDEARSPQLRAELDQLEAFTSDYLRREGAAVTTFSYRAVRQPGSG